MAWLTFQPKLAALIYIDSSGAQALGQLFEACQQKDLLFQLACLRACVLAWTTLGHLAPLRPTCSNW
jgi:hypothetical protein